MCVVSFDFDDTLADEIPTGWGGLCLMPIPKIVDRLREYHALGCTCLILTARTPTDRNKSDIEGFLKSQQVDHCISSVHFTSHAPKGPYAFDLGVHLHYDDADEHLDSCKQYGICVIDTK